LAGRGLAIIRTSSSAVDWVIVFWVGFGLLFCVCTAAGRVSMGLPGAQSTRYVPLVVPVFLGIHLHIQTLAARPVRQILATLIVVGLIAATFPMRAHEASFMKRLKVRKEKWVEVYLATHDIEAADRASRIRIYPWAPEVTQLKTKLDILEERDLNLFRPGSG